MRVYATPDSERCVVKLLDFYISKLPPNPPGFYMYLRPLDKVPGETKPWYCKSRVGINKLKTIIPDVCADCGLSTQYTNHSLRATAITRMYNKGVPEKLISEKSGHRSVKALRVYERTSEMQHKLAGKCVQSAHHPFETSTTVKSTTVVPPAPATLENKENVPLKVQPEPSSGMAQFSGLTGCTFNFYQK